MALTAEPDFMKVQLHGQEYVQGRRDALSLNEMTSGMAVPQSIQSLAWPSAQHFQTASSETCDEGADDDPAALAKRSFQPYHSQRVPKSENLEAHAIESAGNGSPITTMMLRNVPNKYTQDPLLQEINDFGFRGLYNFCYLPMDVHNRSSVGYAFINFELPKDAELFRVTFSEHRFQRFRSPKIGSVCVAHVQGLDANLRHFENRAVTHARINQYRPVVLQGLQRINFDRAATSAKATVYQAKEGLFESKTSTHGCSGPTPNTYGESNPRQGLEEAIRKLLIASKPAPEAGAPRRAAPIDPFTTRFGGHSRKDADIAELLYLRSVLIERLHTRKDVATTPTFVLPRSRSPLL